MSLTVGIDLGTTNSVVAYVDQLGKPQVIPNRAGQRTTPSVVCFKPDRVSIGEEAKEQQELGNYPVAAFFKRQMGDANFVFTAHGKDYSATELSALVLRQLKEDAEAHLKRPVTEAVITVPAYFREGERRATIRAGELAGLRVSQVVNEPTAAAIAYGLNEPKARRILVYDLGGGTFDVTLLELDKSGMRVLTSVGDHRLGGKDWDERIVELLASRFQAEFGIDPLADAQGIADVLVYAERAKKQLSERQSTTITINHAGERGRYELTRDEFDRLTSDLMERTTSLTERALEDFKIAPRALDGILLVGGSTRMPMVSRYIEQLSGKPPMTRVNVDEAVALGAALAGHSHREQPMLFLGGTRKVVDVTNHSLGMIAVDEAGTAYTNSLILPRNAAIPCQQTRPYQHRVVARTSSAPLEIYMTQGEVADPQHVNYLGKYVVHEVPATAGGVTVVEIRYAYDLSGTVSVAARAANRDLEVELQPLPDDVPSRFLLPPPVPKEPEHVTAYLAFDLSGSMGGAPLREAKKAAKGFLLNTDLSHCSLGIIAFSDRVRTKLKACQDARKIERSIDDLSCGETGGGNDGDPFDELHDLLRKGKGRRFGIVLADGVWSEQSAAIGRAKRCHRDSIDVIAIGFGHADKDFLRKIASSDEGSFFTTQEGLVDTFCNIAQVLTETGGDLSKAKAGLWASVRRS